MTEAVNKALEDFIRRYKLEKLANRIGNTELNIDKSDLEEMRKNEIIIKKYLLNQSSNLRK
ncbi:hypothetical protein [Thermovenabulum sp.]|uniref:hypothetical protein n=1 Tax=Thermovenabulum sp. TaxID=3100335 RepID=UPI003C7E8EAD